MVQGWRRQMAGAFLRFCPNRCGGCTSPSRGENVLKGEALCFYFNPRHFRGNTLRVLPSKCFICDPSRFRFGPSPHPCKRAARGGPSGDTFPISQDGAWESEGQANSRTRKVRRSWRSPRLGPKETLFDPQRLHGIDPRRPFYCSCSALIGSSDAARHAGTLLAAPPTTQSRTAVPTSVTGSVART
jgi:hypothetical protein